MDKRIQKGAIIHTAFSDFTIEKQIGSGGNGRVFSATSDNDVKTAIKFITYEGASEKRKRLKNEIHFCEHCNHPNIIKIIDHGYIEFEDGAYFFYVMPLFEETLRQRMKKGISPKSIVKIFYGLLNGLYYAHKEGIVHRDLKPENILLRIDDNNPVICDFGIAHFSTENLITAVNTQKGDKLANFQYAAPEQRARNMTVGPAADLYAAGLILNEMFTGQIPQASDYMTISDVVPEYAYLDELFQLLYRQMPENRLQTAQDVLDQLDNLGFQNGYENEVYGTKQNIDGLQAPAECNLSLKNVSCENGILIFEMSEEVCMEWFGVLISVDFPHQFVEGYNKDRVFLYYNGSLAMKLKGGETQETLKTIISNLKDWVTTTNVIFNEEQRLRPLKEKEEEEKTRNEEEKQRKETERINSLLTLL